MRDVPRRRACRELIAAFLPSRTVPCNWSKPVERSVSVIVLSCHSPFPATSQVALSAKTAFSPSSATASGPRQGTIIRQPIHMQHEIAQFIFMPLNGLQMSPTPRWVTFTPAKAGRISSMSSESMTLPFKIEATRLVKGQRWVRQTST